MSLPKHYNQQLDAAVKTVSETDAKMEPDLDAEIAALSLIKSQLASVMAKLDSLIALQRQETLALQSRRSLTSSWPGAVVPYSGDNTRAIPDVELLKGGLPPGLTQMEAAIVNQRRITEAMSRLPHTPFMQDGLANSQSAIGYNQRALDQRFAADTDEARRMSAAASDPQPLG